MERRSPKEYSVVFLVEGKKSKLLTLPSTTVLLPTRSAQRLSSSHLAAVLRPNLAELVPSGFFCSQPWFMRRSEHIFVRKNTCVCHNTVTCVTRVTSNRLEVHRLNSQHLSIVRTSNVAELVPSGIFCLQPWFLQLAVGTHFRRKITRVYVNPAAINNQVFKY